TARRVPKAALPRDEWRAGKSGPQGDALEPARLQRARAMPLQPDATAGGRGLHRGQTGGKARTICAVGGEVMHLVMQTLRRDRKIAAVAAEHGKSRSVPQSNRAR